MILNKGQQAALDSAIQFLGSATERRMVIKGRAGTGKSTLTQELVPAIEKYAQVIQMILKQDQSLPLYLCATTNKAAKVLGDITNRDTTTIHSLLGLMVRNDYQTGETKLTRKANGEVIKNSVILIDEAFWICPQLEKYLDLCTQNCKIIYIGDPYQCAPVRQTHSPVQDYNCRTEELTQVMRNGGAIQLLGEHWRDTVINQTFSPFTLQDPNIIWANGSDFQDLIDQEYADQTAPETKNKILAWTNNRVIQYCHHVRTLRGLPDTYVEGEYVQINNSLVKQGITTDSIVRLKSFGGATTAYGIKGRNAEIFNRNIQLFIPDSPEQYTQILKDHAAKKNWKAYYEIQECIPDLRSVHSCTVHKGQGSSYDTVFIDLPDIGKCNIASDVARMMHVAVTRARTKVIFRGSLPAKYGG